jgi:predicted RecA/RadA family phage recombinase
MGYQATFVHDGKTIDYTPTADIALGEVVVQGDLIGVAPRAIAANTPGSLAVAGVFDFAKATGAGTGIAAGVNVYWDNTNNVVTTTAAGNKLLGKTVKAAADADAIVRVRLMQ